MQIIAHKNQLGEAPETWLRRAGYAYLPARADGPASFARRLSRDFYPRFHLYFETKPGKTVAEEIVIFNLHLDQKRPGYQGYNRHNAEYDSPVVMAEGERLKSLLLPDFLS